MKLHYYRDPGGNFGDDLNPWLWSRLLGDAFDGREPLFLGIGTLLNDRLPRHLRKVVLGSGAGYGAPPVVDERWIIYCVRGPLTARALGIDQSLACTDAALLLRLVIGPSAGGNDVVFMPHHVSALRAEVEGIDLRAAARKAGLEYVDPRTGVEGCLEQLGAARLVIANAMHAAIVADALRIPWVPVRLYWHEDRAKWSDWTASMEIPYVPVEARRMLRATDVAATLRAAMRSASSLSDETVIGQRLTRMTGLLEKLRHDIDEGRFEFGGEVLPDDPAVAAEDATSYWHELMDAARAIEAALPPGSRFVLIDDQTWGGADFMPGRSMPFPALAGVYQGPPATGAAAVASLAAAVDEGARHVVVSPAARWWLDHYEELARYLETNARVVVGGEGVSIFTLDGAAR